jgi:hypothetical protein
MKMVRDSYSRHAFLRRYEPDQVLGVVLMDLSAARDGSPGCRTNI